jgi:hypothetical protein
MYFSIFSQMVWIGASVVIRERSIKFGLRANNKGVLIPQVVLTEVFKKNKLN